MIMRRFMPILSLLLPWVTAAAVLAEIPTLAQEIRPKTAEQVIEQLCANLTKAALEVLSKDKDGFCNSEEEEKEYLQQADNASVHLLEIIVTEGHMKLLQVSHTL